MKLICATGAATRRNLRVGSARRGHPESDIDVLVALDENHAVGILEYARLLLYITGLFDRRIDVVNQRTLKPLLKSSILNDAVHAF